MNVVKGVNPLVYVVKRHHMKDRKRADTFKGKLSRLKGESIEKDSGWRAFSLLFH